MKPNDSVSWNFQFRFKAFRFYNEQFHRPEGNKGKKKGVWSRISIKEHSLISPSERELKFYFKFTINSYYSINFEGDVILESSQQGEIDKLLESNPAALECLSYDHILHASLANVRKIAVKNRVMIPVPRPPMVIQKRIPGQPLPKTAPGKPLRTGVFEQERPSSIREIKKKGNWDRLKAISSKKLITEIVVPLVPKFQIKQGNYQIGANLVNLTIKPNGIELRAQGKIEEVDVDFSQLPESVPPPHQEIPIFVIECWNEILKQNEKNKQAKVRNLDNLPILVNYRLKNEIIAFAEYGAVRKYRSKKYK